MIVAIRVLLLARYRSRTGTAAESKTKLRDGRTYNRPKRGEVRCLREWATKARSSLTSWFRGPPSPLHTIALGGCPIGPPILPSSGTR